jgi:hypothetical protein
MVCCLKALLFAGFQFAFQWFVPRCPKSFETSVFEFSLLLIRVFSRRIGDASVYRHQLEHGNCNKKDQKDHNNSEVFKT